MSPLLFLAAAAAGGAGAACRFLVDSLVQRHSRAAIPLGTGVVNLSGSLLLGLLTALALGSWLPEQWLLVLGTGLLGGYTTFSTASLETAQLLRQGRGGRALGYAFGMLLGSVLACALGFGLGSLALGLIQG